MSVVLGRRGQFFAQDIIIAIIIFIFSLLLFMVASQSVFSQGDLINTRNAFDESAHITLTTLMEHPGEPVGWEFGELHDVNSFGLAKTNNVIDDAKLQMLMRHMDINYGYAKIQLGVSNFDLLLMLIDNEGNTIVSEGVEVPNASIRLVYERTVYYEGSNAVLVGVFTRE